MATDDAYTKLNLLAKEHPDTKEIGLMLDKVTSQRNFIKASKLNKILENAQRHLAMGEIDAADQAFIEALSLDAANELAQEGLKAVAIWR